MNTTKNTFSKLAAILLAALTLLLSGCTHTLEGLRIDKPGKLYIAVVYGNRKNASVPNSGSPTFSRLMSEAIATSGSVAIITDEGVPRAVADLDYPEPDALTPEATVKKQQRIMLAQTNDLFAQTVPETPEADTLSAVALGIRSLRTRMAAADPGNNDRYALLLYSNALPTAGNLDFAHTNLLQCETGDIISYLEENAAIPDVVGIDVYLLGLGDVSGRQQALNNREIKKLTDIWRTIFEKGGAESVTFAPDLPSGIEPDESFPEVSEVCLVRPIDEQPSPISDTPSSIQADVLFHPDSTELVNLSLAEEALAPYAEELIAHRDKSALLIGTTATIAGNNDGCRVFSYSRASKVKDILVGMGVDSEQLQTVGLGFVNDFHVVDVDSYGNLTNNARLNRAVFVLDLNCEKARELLRTGYRG